MLGAVATRASSASARVLAARVIARVAPWFVSGCTLLALSVFVFGVQIVTTKSVPVGVYLRTSLERAGLRRGDYVCFEGWRDAAPALLREAAHRGAVPAAFVQSDRLTKRVAALGGDRITYEDDHVMVNGRPLAESTALRSSRGVALPQPSYPRLLAADEVWLSSEHARGFDSRYFGPVKRAALSCHAELLWAW